MSHLKGEKEIRASLKLTKEYNLLLKNFKTILNSGLIHRSTNNFQENRK